MHKFTNKRLAFLGIILPVLCCFNPTYAQIFTRTELPTLLTTPWEITYGSDGYLWLTEAGGNVVRVDPTTGNKTVVFTASDFFAGSPLENNPLCHNPPIGQGTLGLALHPNFSNPATSFIYFVYSYNSGTSAVPATKFRIKRLKWDAITESVVADTNIVNNISNGYDHWGGRLISGIQNNVPYLFLSVGDNGISEENAPTCYNPQSSNPNNFAQDPTTMNGKIHRFKMDGSIPADNPIAGNSFYTRGHRNPQGLMYNQAQEILYDVEHGDRTDDEINMLFKGMNYGWKNVRGYRNDNSFPGENAFANNYIPNNAIANDSLVDPIFAWCTSAPSGNNYLDWCTVAPSGGEYYGSSGIAQWTNSLLVVTLKNGTNTDSELFQLKLDADGKMLPSTPANENPKRYFGADTLLNGRLRDLAISPDGRKIYIVNNGGANRDKIIVYSLDTTGFSIPQNNLATIEIFPNPTSTTLKLKNVENFKDFLQLKITTILGQTVLEENQLLTEIPVYSLSKGVYFLTLNFSSGTRIIKFVKE